MTTRRFQRVQEVVSDNRIEVKKLITATLITLQVIEIAAVIFFHARKK
ncbi:hypothetical protein ACMZ5F_31415 [Streptomyces rhizosphaericola]